jgi:hypothetical protein
MALDRLLTDPDYLNANAATKEAIFNKFAANDHRYLDANPATQAAIKEKYGITPNMFAEEIATGRNESLLNPKANERNTGGVILQSLKKAGLGIGDIIGGWPEDVSNMYKYATTPNATLPNKSTPLTNYAARQGFITPQNEPNTPVLKAIDFTTQLGATGGINPMSLMKAGMNKTAMEASKDIAKQFGRTGAAGVVGSATEQGLESLGASPVQQMIGTGLTMSGTGAATGGVRSTPADIVNRGLKGVTPEQMNLAKLLVQDSYKLGAPITGSEAIAQVSGNKSLAGTQRFLENSSSSQGTMNQFMANRPEGARKAFEVTVEGVSPNAPTSATPRNLENAAGQVIKKAESSLTANVEPYFSKAGTNAVNKIDIEGMLQTPRISDAVDYVRSTAKYGVKNEPQNSLKTLIAAKQYLDDEFSKQMNSVTGAEKNAARVTWSANRKLDDFLNYVSPEYAQGSKNFEVAQKTQFEPMKAGPVGKIAEGDVAANVLMPAKPISLYPEDIERTANLLRRKDPSALPDWTRQNLKGIFNETTQKLVGGDNQFGGAKFASTIAGNAQQRKNLEALVTSGSSKNAWQGFEKFLDVVEAQGQRMPANSATSFNEITKAELSGGPVSKALTPFKPSNIVLWAENVQLGKNADMLAKMLTDPDSVSKLEELARTGPKSAKTQALVNALSGSYIAQKPEIVEESK